MCGILPHHSVSPWMAIRKGVTGMQRRKRRETYERPLLKEDFFPPDISETPFLVLTRCRPHWCGRRASTIQSVFPNNRNDQLISKLFARPQSKRLRLLTLCCGLTHHPSFLSISHYLFNFTFPEGSTWRYEILSLKKEHQKKNERKIRNDFSGCEERNSRNILRTTVSRLIPPDKTRLLFVLSDTPILSTLSLSLSF